MDQNIKANSIEKAVIRNTEITDNAEIVEAFTEHFVSIGEKLAAQIENISMNAVDAISKADTKFKFKSIEVCQIIKIIKKLANGTAVGIHSLPNRSLKEGVEVLCVLYSVMLFTLKHTHLISI